MAKDGYAWWKSRLRKMSEYFDAFRIDHILGFFRIWEIPKEYSSGSMGHFNPAIPYRREEIEAMGLPLEGLFLPDPRNPGCVQPRILPESANLPKWQQDSFGALYNDFFFHRNDTLWRHNAERKLPELLDATGMLACGEDLGMVPDCVPGVMEHETILSLEMTSMDKGHPWPRLAVCASSSHDMATLRMQFDEQNGRDMEPWEVRRVLWDHLSSEPMLAIFPLQDWVALDGQLRRKDYKNVILCGCHKDIVEYLKPDILIDLESEKVYDLRGFCLGKASTSPSSELSRSGSERSGRYLLRITI
jgi:4-alpha-glucanotransferase